MADAARNSAVHELTFTRVYDAPRALVFEAWCDPEHVGNWWGPNGFTTTTQAMDVRVGGRWDYVMHGPDGTDYPGRGVYRVVERPARLVFSHVGGRADEPHLTCEMQVTFEDGRGGTELTLRMIFATAAALERAKELGADTGGTESLARLGRAVDGQQG